MQIVIDIPEEVYEEIQTKFLNTKVNNITLTDRAIYNGTPIPKEHGDLKDTDEIIEKIRRLPNGGRQWFVNAEAVFNIILDAPTIIEADKENEQ